MLENLPQMGLIHRHQAAGNSAMRKRPGRGPLNLNSRRAHGRKEKVMRLRTNGEERGGIWKGRIKFQALLSPFPALPGSGRLLTLEGSGMDDVVQMVRTRRVRKTDYISRMPKRHSFCHAVCAGNSVSGGLARWFRLFSGDGIGIGQPGCISLSSARCKTPGTFSPTAGPG